MMKRVN